MEPPPYLRPQQVARFRDQPVGPGPARCSREGAGALREANAPRELARELHFTGCTPPVVASRAARRPSEARRLEPNGLDRQSRSNREGTIRRRYASFCICRGQPDAKFPTASGIPVMAPLEAFNARPAGSAPDVIDQV